MNKYYIWLQGVLRAGNNRVSEIIKYFGSAKTVFDANKETLISSKLFTNAEIRKMKSLPISYAEEIENKCINNGIQIINIKDKKYPKKLLEIANPPLVIYLKGQLPDFEELPSICIVGPRKVSEYGKKAAFSLGYRLSRSGFIVVSGGALGTDTYAHTGALKGEGITVLVMGCGILTDYLSENKTLREAVAENGCLISEYPPDFPASKYTFPIRNRILSALTLGTILVEAPEKSGALITARYACEQGKDVFVIPGAPNQKEYIGSNELLRDGAKPLIDLSDVYNEYIFSFPEKINIKRAYEKKVLGKKKDKKEQNRENNEKNLNETLSKEAKIVYNCIDKQKFLPEEIKNTGLSSTKILSALTELEMEFLIRALPGGVYEKCN